VGKEDFGAVLFSRARNRWLLLVFYLPLHKDVMTKGTRTTMNWKNNWL
jgi:hypothetical protein